VFVAAHLLLFGVPASLMIAVTSWAQPFLCRRRHQRAGHAVGYRSFEMPSTATNLVPVGLLPAARAAQQSPRVSRARRVCGAGWEIDVGWLWIRLFSVPWAGARALGSLRARNWSGGGAPGRRHRERAVHQSHARGWRLRARVCCPCAVSWRA